MKSSDRKLITIHSPILQSRSVASINPPRLRSKPTVHAIVAISFPHTPIYLSVSLPQARLLSSLGLEQVISEHTLRPNPDRKRNRIRRVSRYRNSPSACELCMAGVAEKGSERRSRPGRDRVVHLCRNWFVHLCRSVHRGEKPFTHRIGCGECARAGMPAFGIHRIRGQG